MNKTNPLLIVQSMYPSFHRVEKQIADFILDDTETFIALSVNQVAARTGIASSSIIRFCKTIGYSGLKELKILLAKNLSVKPEAIHEDLKPEDTPGKVLVKVFEATVNSLKNTLETIDKKSFSKAVSLLAKADRIEFYGVGTSASLAMDAYYRFMRVGLPAYAATDPHISRISASKLKQGSVAVGISHTGKTKDTVDSLNIARKQGAKIISITTFQNNPITRGSDVALIVSSTETKVMKEAIASRIAQLAVIDSLYAAVALKQYDQTMREINTISDIYKELRY